MIKAGVTGDKRSSTSIELYIWVHQGCVNMQNHLLNCLEKKKKASEQINKTNETKQPKVLCRSVERENYLPVILHFSGNSDMFCSEVKSQVSFFRLFVVEWFKHSSKANTEYVKPQFFNYFFNKSLSFLATCFHLVL